MNIFDDIAVEAAAKAIWYTENDAPWDEYSDSKKEPYRKKARAASEAMPASLRERGMLQIALIEGDKVQGFWSELGVERKIAIIKRGDWP